MTRYLFITGCARSGTTALWRLITAHTATAIGLERYILLAQGGGEMTPALFDRRRFFDLQPGDTFYADLDGFSRYYAGLRERYDAASHVGDKQPSLYRHYDSIERNFAPATVLYIVRNVIDVAGSYEGRAANGPATRWHLGRALADWGTSLRNTRLWLDAPGRRTRIIVVSYEELFLRRADIRPLFAALELDCPAEVDAEYDRAMRKSLELQSRRGDRLNSAQRQTIALTAPFELFRRVHADRLVLPALADLSGPA